MNDCIFCKIIAGEIPSHKVYEDENFLGFLDINPRAPGHVQLIPKKHFRWVWDLPSDQKTSPNSAEYFEIVHKIANAQKKAFETQMILLRITGEEVPHAHIWIYPDPKVEGDKKDLEGNVEKIKTYLK